MHTNIRGLFAGILRDKTIADKSIYIFNRFCRLVGSSNSKRLNTQLNNLTNQNLLKVPKVVKPTNKKTLWISVTTAHCTISLWLCDYQ